MKKMLKIAMTLLMVTMMITMYISPVFAWDPAIPEGTSSTAATNATNLGNNVLGIVKVVGYAGAVIMLIIVAIKYLTASASEKADLKKNLITYVIGAIILFAASTIIAIVQNFASSAF